MDHSAAPAVYPFQTPFMYDQMRQVEFAENMYKQAQLASVTMTNGPMQLGPNALLTSPLLLGVPTNSPASFPMAQIPKAPTSAPPHPFTTGPVFAHTTQFVPDQLQPELKASKPVRAIESPIKLDHSNSGQEDEEEGARIEMLEAATRTIRAISPKVTVTAEVLANMSTHELELYIRPLDLTLDQEKQLKRQRRLIRNRESAHFSRIRKKKYVEELQEKIAGLTETNSQLVQELTMVKATNAKLRTELDAYRSGSMPRDQPTPMAVSELAPTDRRGSTQAPSMTTKAPSFYLLAILFVFGMVLSLPRTDQSTIFPAMAFGSFSNVRFSEYVLLFQVIGKRIIG